MNQLTVKIHSLEDTKRWGYALGQVLEEPVCILLEGPMGAGKTHVTKAIAEGLGVEEKVTSPTFALMNTYESGRVRMHHFDLYRLEDAEELQAIGFLDYAQDGVSVVEWADSFPEEMPESFIRIRVTIGEGEERTFTVEAEEIEEELWSKVEEVCHAISH